jgi:hypothetical protein
MREVLSSFSELVVANHLASPNDRRQSVMKFSSEWQTGGVDTTRSLRPQLWAPLLIRSDRIRRAGVGKKKNPPKELMGQLRVQAVTQPGPRET